MKPVQGVTARSGQLHALLPHEETRDMEKTITYYEKSGPDNTEETLRAASMRCRELGLKKVILASSFGVTGVKALQYFDPREMAVVTSMYG